MATDRYEWDDRKNESNQRKHGIDFEDVKDAFQDKNRLIAATDRNGERRYITIGKALDIILTIVYTIRNLSYRIISARPSRKDERKRYLSKSLTKQDQDYDNNA